MEDSKSKSRQNGHMTKVFVLIKAEHIHSMKRLP